ncbi:hypothetical protein [Peribacillus sp. SCS-37]|uniref:hypothetical protein n=1 Tax=Paraperibacillus esterisolvens TaxID=3115296 RepID=UPI0039069291
MKVYSTWKNSTYLFHFFIDSVASLDLLGQEKVALVDTGIFTKDKELLWEGSISVKLNSFGIYPLPEDISKIPLPQSILRMLIIELRRYIKPQKQFL